MLHDSKDLTTKANSGKPCGLILGYWDQEKTPLIIKDLEESINLVEKKCKKLLQHLIYYKKYSDEMYTSGFQKKLCVKGNIKKSHSTTGSVPDLSCRKNFIDFQEFEEVFHERFKQKLNSIHKKLLDTADKIGLNDSVYLFPTKNYREKLNKAAESQLEKSWSKVGEVFLKMRSTSKSDSTIGNMNDESNYRGFSSVSKNNFILSQNLSKTSLSVNTRKKPKPKKIGKLRVVINLPRFKNKSANRTVAFGRCVTTNQEEKSRGTNRKKSNKSRRSKKKIKRKLFVNALTKQSSKTKEKKSNLNVSASNYSTLSSNEKVKISDTKDSDLEILCEALTKAIEDKNSIRKQGPKHDNLIENTCTLRSFVSKVIPFTPCTSTSRSYNIGMNIQQFLSLAKYKKKNGAKGVSNFTVNFPERRLVNPQTSTLSQQETNQAMLSSRGTSNYTSDSWIPQKTGSYEREEINEVEHNENVWISKHCTSSNIRKVRSKYTGSLPEGFVEYHKSTTSQYIHGQESLIKSESKSAYAVGSKIMLSDCQRTDFYEIDNNNSYFQQASGDCFSNQACSKMRLPWSRIYRTFSDLYKKYEELKVQASTNQESFTEAQVKSLEEEIEKAIEKYKEFLKCYSKFLQLKHRLKSLKIACGREIEAPESNSSSKSSRRLECKSTSSVAMKKIFRDVQILQDKIKSVNEY